MTALTGCCINMISTIAMVQIGKVYENLMVDVKTAANAKLRDRGARIIQASTGLSRQTSLILLDAAGGSVKTGLVMHARQVGRDVAERLLAEFDGRMDQAVQPREPIS